MTVHLGMNTQRMLQQNPFRDGEQKKKYYVKIRAYKKVGKTKYYGEWSRVNTVKIE